MIYFVVKKCDFSHLISSHLISSHLISSHLISFRFITTEFLVFLKRIATHIHFFSIVAILFCTVFAWKLVYPYCVYLLFSSFIVSFGLPPFGLIDAETFLPSKAAKKDPKKEKKAAAKETKKLK